MNLRSAATYRIVKTRSIADCFGDVFYAWVWKCGWIYPFDLNLDVETRNSVSSDLRALPCMFSCADARFRESRTNRTESWGQCSFVFVR